MNVTQMLKDLYLLAVHDLVIMNGQLIFEDRSSLVDVVRPQGNVIPAFDKQFLTAQAFDQVSVTDDRKIGT